MHNINQIESKVLFKKKILEGKDEDIAGFEIERDKYFIRNLEDETKSKEKYIKSLDKQIAKKRLEYQKLEDKLNKKRNQVVKSISNPNSNNGRNASTYHLNRIILCLSENPGISITQIRNFCLISNSGVANDGLNFLLKHNFIRKVQDRGMQNYYLNEELKY